MRSPRGVATKPASSRALRSGVASRRAPSSCCAVGLLDREPAERAAAYGVGERLGRPGASRSGSSVKVSSVRPPRST